VAAARRALDGLDPTRTRARVSGGRQIQRPDSLSEPPRRTPEGDGLLRRAFPERVREDVDAVCDLIPPSRLNPVTGETWKGRGGSVRIDGEAVQTVGRIYNPVLETIPAGALPPERAQLLACLYSRHANGFVRERQLPSIFDTEATWTPLFVLQLLGEYVVEIAAAIDQHLARLDRSAFIAFRDTNPDFVALTCERVVSYWRCYFASTRLVDHPPHRVMASLDLWTGREGRRWVGSRGQRRP
jgi:hypothetical protein